MDSKINTKILATIFVAMTTLGAVTVASVEGISMIAPAFAQGGNMTDGGNATEGNMTGSDNGRKRNGNTSSDSTISRMHIYK